MTDTITPESTLADEVREIAARDRELTNEINRTATAYGYDTIAVHKRMNFRLMAFEHLLELALKASEARQP